MADNPREKWFLEADCWVIDIWIADPGKKLVAGALSAGSIIQTQLGATSDEALSKIAQHARQLMDAKNSRCCDLLVKRTGKLEYHGRSTSEADSPERFIYDGIRFETVR